MQRILEVNGQREALRPPDLGLWQDLIGAQALDAVRIAATRDGQADKLRLEAADDDVVEVEFADGVKLWMRVDEIPTELKVQPVRDSTGTLLIPSAVPIRVGAQRGLGSLILTGLRVFRVDDSLAGLAARELAEKLESRRQPGDGLYACEQPGELEPAKLLAGTDPILVLVHGTLSSTEGAFGKLTLEAGAGGAAWPEIKRRYGKRILAFEHRTLSESPVESALKLAEGLAAFVPQDAKLHLVSHSRGGLVGELLCRAQRVDGLPAFDESDLRIFTEAKDPLWRERDPEALRGLNEIFRRQKWQIERFARVAATARGTILASERLDRWLSIVLNVIGLATGTAGNPVYSFAKSTLLAFAKRRTRPDELPGLAAQMPGSPLVAMLNRQKVIVEGRLSVIAGDCQGHGFFGTLKVLAADLFFREDHDLVVQTAGMEGGAPRQGRTERYLDRGGEVDHFHYFANPRTRQRLIDALDGKDFPAEEGAPAVSRAPAVKLAQPTDDGSKPFLFILPGIMGSHLSVGGDRIWVDYDNLLFGGFSMLDLRSSKPAKPDGLLHDAYQGIADFLSVSHFVQLFDYDWRRSLAEAATHFAVALADRFRPDSKRPVRILAHSMGGLVARLTFAERPELWEEFRKRPGCRLVMAGTPNSGSWSIVAVLLGQDRMIRLLAGMDLKHSMAEILQTVSRFPGVLELLPAPTPEWDFFSPGAWDRLEKDAATVGWVRPPEDLLKAAAEVRRRLASAPVDPSRMTYVAGLSEGTPDRVRFDPKGQPWVVMQGDGDGRSLWKDGPPQGVPTWYRRSVHGDLLVGDGEAYADLLRDGATQRLSSQPPTSRANARSVDLEDLAVPVGALPSPQELERVILGAEPAVALGADRRLLQVSVIHGNVVYATAATAVGHYQGDGLFSAEADLDRRLGGELRRRLAVGLYPGAAGTAEVIFPDGRQDLGAIVVGLGRIGELTPGDLADGVARGVLRYVMALKERRRTPAFPEGIGRRFSTLLIGSTEGSTLTLLDSLRGILKGVTAANRVLEKLAEPGVSLVEEVEVIELWEDRALRAAHHVRELADAGDVEIREGGWPFQRWAGGRRRAFEESRGGWWRQLQIQYSQDGTLSYVAHTDKARVERKLVATQVELIRDLIRRPTSSSRVDPAIGVTLHELLLPEVLKGLSQGQQRLAFQLNDRAAEFPWELLVDRGNDSDTQSGQTQTPLAVRTGLVRQLVTDDFREHVLRCDRPSALVIADPASSATLPPLPGARAEAREVRLALRSRGYDVASVGRFEVGDVQSTDPIELLSHLMGRGYQVVHLAGHGTHDPKNSKRSGLVIGVQGDEDGKPSFLLLTPAEIRQLREVPNLVFINACHLARMDEGKPSVLPQPDRVVLAANLGVELIRMGVRAVIAAGWEVDDEAAKTFASRFYQSFLGGACFGDAVLQAREEVHRCHSEVNTWGAYQCYGDPYYSLRGPQEIQSEAPHWVDPGEARNALDNLVADLRVPQNDGGRRVRERLERLERTLPPGWLHRPMVASSLARVYQELGDFERALAFYDAAFATDSEGVEIEAVEQWVRTVVQDAFERFRFGKTPSGQTPREWANAKIQNALGRLKQLQSLGDTADRYSRQASAFKRLAFINDHRETLKAASRIYLAAAKQRPEVVYYEVNYALCQFLAFQPLAKDSAVHQDLLGRLEITIDRATRLRDSRPVFESSINLADARLLQALLKGQIAKAASKAEVVEEYKRVFERGVTPIQARGMDDQLAILNWGVEKGHKRHIESVRAALDSELTQARG